MSDEMKAEMEAIKRDMDRIVDMQRKLFWTGLGMLPVAGTAIAMLGMYMGQVDRNAESLKAINETVTEIQINQALSARVQPQPWPALRAEVESAE